MKFKSIKLKNFRVFPELSLDFSTDPEKNVTLLIGENRSGKTTFSQAMIWCLFGTSYTTTTALGTSSRDNKFFKLDPNQLWASTVKDKCKPGDVIETSVTLVIENNSVEYEFSRTVSYKMTTSGFESKSDNPMCIIHRPGEPVSTLASKDEVRDEVYKLLPGKLVEFVFFNGEQINTFSEQLQNDNSAEYLRDAVDTLLGNKEFEKAIKHLGGIQGFKSVNRMLEDKLNELSSKDTDKTIIEKINSAADERAELKEANRQHEVRKSELNKLIPEYEKEIEDNQEAAGHQNRIKELKRVNEQLERDNEDILNGLLSNLRNDLFSFIIGKYCCKILAKLHDHTDLCSKDIPSITSDTIDYIIKHGKCICGTEIHPDSSELKVLLALKEFIPPKDIGGMVGDYLETIRSFYEQAPDCKDVFEKVVRQKDAYLNNDNQSEKNDSRITEIGSRLRSQSNFGEAVSQARRNIEEAHKEIGRLEAEQRHNIEKIEELDTTLKSLKSSRQNALRDNTTAALYTRALQYSEAVISYIDKQLESDTANIKKNLDANVKRIFTDLGWDDCELRIDDEYKFSCVNKSDNISYQLSTAQGLVSAISCIAGIINLTKEKLKRDPSKAGISNNIPLIMDAPLSAFDKQHAARFCKHLPTLIDQLVIFTKDTEGYDAAESMKDRIGKMYVIRKQSVSDSTSSNNESNLSYVEEQDLS